MDGATEATGTYSRRPPQPDPPRHPSGSQLLLLPLLRLLQVQGCKPCKTNTPLLCLLAELLPVLQRLRHQRLQVLLATAAVGGCRPLVGTSFRYQYPTQCRPTVGTHQSRTPFRQIAENCRRRGGSGGRGVSGMDTATKPPWMGLRRPLPPDPPRLPSGNQLLLLLRPLTLICSRFRAASPAAHTPLSIPRTGLSASRARHPARCTATESPALPSPS